MFGKIAELYQYKYLIYCLVIKDLKVKYKGSFLGFFWSLLNTLLMLIMYTIAFKYVMKIKVENFPIFLLSGFLPWVFLSSSLSMSVSSIIDNSNLVKKVFFPRVILPLSTVLVNLVQFLLSFIILLPALLFFKIKLGPALILLPLIIFLQLLFVLGFSFILSAMCVFYRDIKHLLEIFLQIWFWGCPIIYPVTMIPEKLRFYYFFNPFTNFVEGYRSILLNDKIPPLTNFMALIIIGFGFILVGYYIFGSYHKKFAEEV